MWSETARLAALRRYDILDADTDAIFDDFVKIAAEICNAPIALVSFVDEARQWFAAELGLGTKETPIDQSVCAHAIRQSDVFVVPDLAVDPRFTENPLVTGAPNLRFYAGAVLTTPEGLPLGSMCILDTEPRPAGLTARQAETLEALARQVMAQLQLRLALRQLTAAAAAQETLLAEKDLLMQEVHHRVKNSLATVQALLLLQARTTSDAEAARQLRESAGRVRTFGAMHEHLYRVDASSQVNIAAYLESLMTEQQAASACTLQGRRIIVHAPSVLWPSTEAPNLGLIVLELVTNALKYGAGQITVTLEQAGTQIVLMVEDEGAGMPPGFDPASSRGLGMRLITGLLRRYGGGRLVVDPSRGHTCFVAAMTIAGAALADAVAA
jgi:two-component sensor histidine kinase